MSAAGPRSDSGQPRPAPATGAVHPRPPLPPGPYAVIGLARSGSAAALALASVGERVVGLDDAAASDAARLTAAGVEVRTGAHAQSLPPQVRAVVKSPGVPQHAAAVKEAHSRGLTVLGELELGWRLLPNRFIAVTGTNGKTTTAELIGHVHRVAGLPVVVAGNVGTALSGLVGRLDPGTTVVCEASSFQLEDTECFAPEAALLINLTPDHLDRHRTFAAYVHAKSRAFERQLPDDLAVLPSSLLDGGAQAPDAGTTGGADTPGGSEADGAGAAGRPGAASAGDAAAAQVAALVTAGAAQRVSFGAARDADLCDLEGELKWRGERLIAAHEIALPGRHNVENAMAAAAVCLARGVGSEAVAEALRSFAGVRHRLEQVASRAGVRFVNDSKATNIASTLVALRTLGDEGAIRLIVGGQGKGQDFTALVGAVRECCRAVYLIGEDATPIA
ncbi:MAG TPA: UDP-N-acetylmuramoyl-L-alanine--D-glutamate ligase, partial [Solirubrobacteraceae bacterium]|nr:UDP-N-acetylmuramoyl-L-alanine--D-glutamate ligase [Solirubrobacteraceae bacterium]